MKNNLQYLLANFAAAHISSSTLCSYCLFSITKLLAGEEYGGVIDVDRKSYDENQSDLLNSTISAGLAENGEGEVAVGSSFGKMASEKVSMKSMLHQIQGLALPEPDRNGLSGSSDMNKNENFGLDRVTVWKKTSKGSFYNLSSRLACTQSTASSPVASPLPRLARSASMSTVISTSAERPRPGPAGDKKWRRRSSAPSLSNAAATMAQPTTE